MRRVKTADFALTFDYYTSSYVMEKKSKSTSVIDIFSANMDEVEKQHVNFFEGCLSKDELLRESSYKYQKDKRKFIIRRGVLRGILSNYITIPPEQISFNYNKYGKPSVPENEIYFNTSHSGSHLVLAFSRSCEIGIDIEEYSEFDNVDGIIKTICNHNESFEIKKRRNCNTNESVLKYWVAKEAYLKNRGDGLSIDPRCVEIVFSKETSGSSKVLFDGLTPADFTLHTWEEHNSFKLYYALSANNQAVLNFSKIEFSNLYIKNKLLVPQLGNKPPISCDLAALNRSEEFSA